MGTISVNLTKWENLMFLRENIKGVIQKFMVACLAVAFTQGCTTSSFIRGEQQLNEVDFQTDGVVVGKFQNVDKDFNSWIDTMQDYTFLFSGQKEGETEVFKAKIRPFADDQGNVFFTLPAGVYTGDYFYKNTSSTYMQSLTRYPFRINFEVKPNTVTNLGYLFILRNEPDKKYFIVAIDNEDEILQFLDHKNSPYIERLDKSNLSVATTIDGRQITFPSIQNAIKLLYPEDNP